MVGSCQGCKKPLSAGDRVALIAGRVMGDEVVDAFYRCSACKAYSLQSVRDSFTTGEHLAWYGPFPEEKAASRLAAIRGCDEPGNDRCRCSAHRSYFGSALD